ncbi:MAG: hypothetical protein EXX96DRAFT_451051, partial [Benjaminiella poitrasii]
PYTSEDFFKRPLPDADRRRFLFECPKNASREYDPPKLNHVRLSHQAKQFDSHLY